MPRLLVAAILAFGIPLSAVELSTIASAAVQAPLLEMARAFEQQTGHVVKIEFDTVPNIVRRLGTGAAVPGDVLVATTAAVAEAAKNGKVDAATRVALGRIGVGVAVSRGSAKPDISTVEALRAAILAADGVVTSQGTSGAYVMTMLADIGVLEQIKGKLTRAASGVHVMERLGTSRNEIGFTMLSEVMRGSAGGGGDVVGPLPRQIQNFTAYEAVVMASAAAPVEARQFVRTLGSAAARKLFMASGWQVPNVRAQ